VVDAERTGGSNEVAQHNGVGDRTGHGLFKIVPNARPGELADDDGLRGYAVPCRSADILQASPRIALSKIVREVWSGICWAFRVVKQKGWPYGRPLLA
jgi:hypothetical protein